MPAKKQPAFGAILLCYPFGQEYMRAHKAFRQLANLLSRKGFDVFRFDYLGTGDSYGNSEDVLFSTYVESANSVLAHLNENSNYSQINLAGLRLGALVAASCLSQNPKVKRCILWDPIATGEHFNAECMSYAYKGDLECETWNIHGYPLTAAFRQHIEQISIADVGVLAGQSLSLISSCENSNTDIVRSLKGKIALDEQLVPPANDWNYVDMVGSILIPSQIIKAVVTALSSPKTS